MLTCSYDMVCRHLAMALSLTREKEVAAVASAVQVTHVLMHKLPHIYANVMRKQGVVHQLKQLADAHIDELKHVASAPTLPDASRHRRASSTNRRATEVARAHTRHHTSSLHPAQPLQRQHQSETTLLHRVPSAASPADALATTGEESNDAPSLDAGASRDSLSNSVITFAQPPPPPPYHTHALDDMFVLPHFSGVDPVAPASTRGDAPLLAALGVPSESSTSAPAINQPGDLAQQSAAAHNLKRSLTTATTVVTPDATVSSTQAVIEKAPAPAQVPAPTKHRTSKR